MSTATKWLIGILIVLNVFLAGLIAVMFGHHYDYKNRWEKTKDEKQQLKQEKNEQISQLKSQLQAKKEEYANLRQDKTELEKTLEERDNTIDEQNDELKEREQKIDELQKERANLRTTLDEKNNIIDQNRQTIDQLQSQLSDWKQKANRLNQNLKETRAQLRTTEVNLNDIQERFVDTKIQLKDTENLLSKYRSKYGPISPKVAPPVEGNVKAVSDSMNLALINLGEEDEVREGMKLSVLRGDKFITEVEVIKVRRTWSAVRSIKEMQLRQPIKAGDVVTSYEPVPQGGGTNDN